MMIGIVSYGGYIPRLRMDRMGIYGAMGWFAPATVMVAQGERSLCNWDEDSLTMAVASAWDCVEGRDRGLIDACYLASTTAPFADRQNAGILKAALNLKDDVLTADITSSLKSGTAALVTGLEAVRTGERRQALVTATDRREAKTAYFYEMWFGDGAASLLVGSEGVIAEYRGSFSVSHDFVDHYRGAGRRFDYMWEERWVRDLGYSTIIPQAVNGLLDKLGLSIDAIDKLVFPCFFKAEHQAIAKKLGVAPGSMKVVDTMHETCGETGAAHPLVMLVSALEKAKPGEKILVASFGQGSDALLFEVTDAITKVPARRGIAGSLARKKTIDSYPRFLKFRDLVEPEMGIRAEVPMQTAMTVLWRKRKMLLGLVGGKCRECGTAQFPKTEVCVNPACGAMHSQEEYEFSRRPAKVKTYTGDLLAVSVDPPAVYGMVQFEGGGRFMAEFTDCHMDDVQVGQPVEMTFRRRYVDRERGFSGYFWKAIPRPMPKKPFEIRFDGRVAVVTGAGGGLGRVYALELAKRGAKVVVNDLGGPPDGLGEGSARPADAVVAEIRAAGGEAVANYDSVATPEGGQAIIDAAVNAFGRIDILINNAGILRDRSFVKQDAESWRAVMDVHLDGAFNVTRPAFLKMKDQGYGRIVMTTSAAGLYGNFGQTNYGAAKLGLVGFMNTLELEGKKYDIKVNTVAPLAASRLTESILPPDVLGRVKPEYVSPLVLYFCSKECPVSGTVINAGAGMFTRAEVLTGKGVVLDTATLTPEQVERSWKAIDSLEGAREHTDAMTFVSAMMEAGRAEPAPAAGGGGGGGGEIAKVFKEGMPAAFDTGAAAGVNVVFQFDLSGPDPGQWWAAVKDGALSVGQGQTDQPTVTIKMASGDFLQLIAGKLDAMAAYTLGKLKLSGDVMKSRLIMKLFKFGK
jgi:3-hydroxy-3-methylglutaryl CoA synthase/NAD(P)-dependent dehydrogenase (short-subunit alcohol dehydrogenase family)/putative sterol carrier protein